MEENIIVNNAKHKLKEYAKNDKRCELLITTVAEYLEDTLSPKVFFEKSYEFVEQLKGKMKEEREGGDDRATLKDKIKKNKIEKMTIGNVEVPNQVRTADQMIFTLFNVNLGEIATEALGEEFGKKVKELNRPRLLGRLELIGDEVTAERIIRKTNLERMKIRTIHNQILNIRNTIEKMFDKYPEIKLQKGSDTKEGLDTFGEHTEKGFYIQTNNGIPNKLVTPLGCLTLHSKLLIPAGGVKNRDEFMKELRGKLGLKAYNGTKYQATKLEGGIKLSESIAKQR